MCSACVVTYNILSIRDVQDELSPYFHSILKVLTELVDKTAQCGGSSRVKGGTTDVQVTGKIFECMAHLLRYTNTSNPIQTIKTITLSDHSIQSIHLSIYHTHPYVASTCHRYQIDVLVQQPDSLRPYYGPLIGHRTEFIRDFSAQTFSFFLRKLPTKAYRTHFKRLVKALASSCRTADGMAVKCVTELAISPVEVDRSNSISNDIGTSNEQSLSPRVQDLLNGVAQLLSCAFKGVKGCFHSKGGKMLSVHLAAMLPLSPAVVEEVLAVDGAKTNGKTSAKRPRREKVPEVSEAPHRGPLKVPLDVLSESTQKVLVGMTNLDCLQIYCTGRVTLECMRRLFRHLHPSNMAELWLRVLEMVQGVVQLWTAMRRLSEPSQELSWSAEIASMYAIELLLFGFRHSGGRALSADTVRTSLSDVLISSVMDLVDNCLDGSSLSKGSVLVTSARLARGARRLFCQAWSTFTGHPAFLKRVRHTIHLVLAPSSDPAGAGGWVALGVEIVHSELFAHLPRAITSAYLLKPLLAAILAVQTGHSTGPHKDSTASWVTLLHGVLTHFAENRQQADGTGGVRVIDNAVSERSDKAGTSMGAALLTVGSEELLNLTESVIALFLVDPDTFSSADPQQLEVQTRAALCVTWLADVCPQLFCRSHSNKAALQLVAHLHQTLIPFLLARENDKITHSVQVLLAHVVRTLCALCAMWTGSSDIPEEVGVALVFVMSDLLPSLVEVVSHNPRSMMLLWALLGVLELGIYPSSALNEQPEKRMILAGVLGHRKEASLLQAMADALLSPSHWLRVCALRILLFLPPPATVQQKLSSTNHATSASTTGDGGDLDDEPETSERRVMDVVWLCFEAACLPASIHQEREYTRRLGQLELFVASSRLPTEHLRLVCSFCLGMVHYKFQPLWEPAINVLVAAVNCDDGKEVVWPLILDSIQRLSNTDEACTIYEDVTQAAPTVRALVEVNSGEERVPPALATSNIFIFAVARDHDNFTVEPDSRTDVHTALNSVWNILQKSPVITLGNSRAVVSLFLRYFCSSGTCGISFFDNMMYCRFLKYQYYTVFAQDPEVPTLQRMGVFSTDISLPTYSRVQSSHVPVLAVSVLKKRLSLFLRVFAAVSSPKQLYQHQQLYYYYCTILSKPDADLVKLALDCIMTYKVPSLVPYKDSLCRFLDDSTFRDELLVFDTTLESGVVNSDHRAVLIPVIVRVLYGRFVSRGKGSKAAREQGIARWVCPL